MHTRCNRDANARERSPQLRRSIEDCLRIVRKSRQGRHLENGAGWKDALEAASRSHLQTNGWLPLLVTIVTRAP